MKTNKQCTLAFQAAGLLSRSFGLMWGKFSSADYANLRDRVMSMALSMFRRSDKFQILRAIIQSVMILMMNLLPGFQRSSYGLFHHPSVLAYFAPVWCGYLSVTTLKLLIRDSLVNSTTSART
jgi:hypothetical protein